MFQKSIEVFFLQFKWKNIFLLNYILLFISYILLKCNYIFITADSIPHYLDVVEIKLLKQIFTSANYVFLEYNICDLAKWTWSRNSTS